MAEHPRAITFCIGRQHSRFSHRSGGVCSKRLVQELKNSTPAFSERRGSPRCLPRSKCSLRSDPVHSVNAAAKTARHSAGGDGPPEA